MSLSLAVWDSITMSLTSADLKNRLKESECQGLVLDIDETLAATNVAWFQRLAALFGQPPDMSVDQLLETYHLAQHVPCWQTAEAADWMAAQRISPEAQDGLPIISGAVEGVRKLQEITPLVGYLTVRPESVAKNTIAWLKASGFPDLPVVSKPDDLPFQEGNPWKAKTFALKKTWIFSCIRLSVPSLLPWFSTCFTFLP